MNSFNTQVQVEETIPTCPYCDKPLRGASVNGLHPECNRKFAAELEEAEQPRRAKSRSLRFLVARLI